MLRWCRFIEPRTLLEVFSETEFQNLEIVGLIKKHRGSGAYILTGKGSQLLDLHCGNQVLPEIQRSYRDADIQRRLYISRLMLTAYQAGVEVFTTAIDDLRKNPSMFLPSNNRGRGVNLWANTRLSAVLHLGDAKYAAHHICADVGRLLLADELAAFSRNTGRLHCDRQALIFFGESYVELMNELERSAEPATGRLVQYSEAYRRSPLPVHLLTCGRTGALQMRIMAIPEYRRKFTRIILNSRYAPPPEDFVDCDAFYEGNPFIMAADMDMRRMDAAVQTACRLKYGPVVLAALPEQAEPFLYARYRDTGKARVFTLTEDALEAFLGTGILFHVPSRQQYLTAKGDVIDAPPIKTRRKA